MGLRDSILYFASSNPELARQIIIQATTAEQGSTEALEYVYLFEGTHVIDGSPVHKIGRSADPNLRIKQVRSKALFGTDWREVHRITCFSTRIGIHPSAGDTLEKLLHRMFARYQIARAAGVEYFSLPVDEITFITSLSIIESITLNTYCINAGVRGAS